MRMRRLKTGMQVALSANDIAAQLLSSASGRRFAVGELALRPQIIPHSSQRDLQCTF